MIQINSYWIIFCTVSVELAALKLDEISKSYDGAQIWRTRLHNASEMEFFQNLSRSGDISLWYLKPTRVDYLVHEDQRVKVHRALRTRNLNHSVTIMNVQRRIDATRSGPAVWSDSSLRVGHRLDFESYPTLTVINEYLDYLAENFDSICQLETIGMTAENRSIRMVKISNKNPSNKAIIIQGGIHAREWIGVSSAMYILNNIVTKFDDQPTYMKHKDWYIIPVGNPDGYDYSHKADRLWRKSRSRNNSNCRGVDLNRNYAKLWRDTGSQECSEDYPGAAPFTEPETKAMRTFLNSLINKGTMPEAFIDFHAFGQMIVRPYGVDSEPPTNINKLRSTSKAMAEAMRKATGSLYKGGNAPELLYEVYGTAMDWFHAEGVGLSYAIETRDTGNHGFLLPPDQIVQTGKELLGAIRALAKTLDPDVRKWF